MEACVSCGKPLADDMSWCDLCHRRVLRLDPRELVQDLQSSFTDRQWWEAPAHLTGPPPAKRWSRMRAGPISFGWIGRATLTCWVLLAAASVMSLAAWHRVFFGVTAVPVAVSSLLLLREIWRRARIE